MTASCTASCTLQCTTSVQGGQSPHRLESWVSSNLIINQGAAMTRDEQMNTVCRLSSYPWMLARSVSMSGTMSRGSRDSSYRRAGCPRSSSRNFSKFHLFDSKNIYLIKWLIKKYFGRYFNFSWYLLFFPLSLTWYRPDDRVHSRAHEGTGTFSSLTGSASWDTCRWDSGSCH